MTLNFEISQGAEEQLRKGAAANGLSVEEYARRVLEGAVARPTVDEILEPYRRQVAESGMSDAEMDEFHRGLIEEVRRRRKSA